MQAIPASIQSASVAKRPIYLVFLLEGNTDFSPLLEDRLKARGLETESIGVPYEWMYDRKYVKNLRHLISEKAEAGFVVFFGDSSEIFLREADLQLCFSAYSRWFDRQKMQVIPHAWTPKRNPQNAAAFLWDDKPPLRAGFMGRTFKAVRAPNYALRLPRAARNFLMSGSIKRFPEVAGLLQDRLGHSMKSVYAFPRLETIFALEKFRGKYPDVDVEIIDTDFVGSSQQLNAYEEHLLRNTYILCPRGTENYSFRAYEALSFGRVPVIVDTDVVLPDSVAWDRLALRVPHTSLDKIYEIIREDYYSRSASEFISRQREALAAIADVSSLRWIDALASQINSMVTKKS